MSSSVRPVAWLIAAALATGVAWGLSVPAFESPDESVYFKSAMNYAAAGAHELPLYDTLMKPIAGLRPRSGRPLQMEYNPAFRFVSNRHGSVNMFMHGRSEKTARADLEQLSVLRGVTLLIWIVALVLTFFTARWFFARDDLALATAILCLSIPGLSFFASKMHPEAITALLGAAAYTLLAARATGRIGRIAAWVLGLTLMGLAPFSDRQGFFVLLLIPFGLIVTERTWRHAAAAIAILMIPAALLLVLPPFRHLQSEFWDTIVHSFAPSYNGGWYNPENRRYFAYEVFPKLFFGFWGWLGQPSILLPPALYAACAAGGWIGIAGWALPRDREPWTAAQRRMVWIFAAGFFVTLAPIIYANLFISRNSWHGRWLYPSVAPVMIALVGGWRASLSFARRRPFAAAVALIGVAAVLELLWLLPPGDFVRTGILGNHYGDRAHFTSTIALTFAMLAAAGVLALLVPRLPSTPGRLPLLVAAAAWTANLLLLAYFVVPLYRPLDDSGFVTAVRGEVEAAESGRASALYRIARATYPESVALRRLGDEMPALLLGGADNQQLAELEGRIARGDALRSRDDVMALIRAGRITGFLEPAVVHAVIDGQESGEVSPDVAEAMTLLRATFDAGSNRPRAADVIRAGDGVALDESIPNKLHLEGYTVHRDAGGRWEVTVYFTPLKPWQGRVLWLQAFPEGADYISFDSAPPPVAWKAGELAWERFILPGHLRFNSFVGITEGSVSGNAVPLGWVPR